MDVSFTAYDTSGAVLGQSSNSASLLRAGRESAVGAQIDVTPGAEVAKVVATASSLPGLSQRDANPGSSFNTKGVTYVPHQITPKIVGEVESNYKQSVTQVHVTAVCYDAASQIIGGGEHYVTAIGSGQTVGFEVNNPITSGKPERCDAFADLSVASQGS